MTDQQMTIEQARPMCAVSIDFKVRQDCTLAEWVAEVAVVAARAWPVVKDAVAS